MQRIICLQLVFFAGLAILSILNLESPLVYAFENQNGACNATDVEYAINPNNNNFPKHLDKCASDSWGEEEKTTKCIKGQYPTLSDGCASCFGKLIGCSSAHCKSTCLFNHFIDACLECVEKKCRENNKENSFSLVACTGLEKHQMPPAKPHG